MIINEWRTNRRLRREVDAWIADAEDRAMYRDVGQALAGFSLLLDAAEAGSIPAEQLRPLGDKFELLANALGGGRGA